MLRPCAAGLVLWLHVASLLGALDGPSVILITVDTLRADQVEFAGFQKLADRGVGFREAVAPSPLTLPSHATLLTGLWPFQHGVRDNVGFVLSQESVTLAEILRQQNYRTAAFLSSVVLRRGLGIDQGFEIYDDDLGGSPERRAEETLQRARSWIEQRSPAPFFCWIHLYDPHLPYAPPAPFPQTYAGEVGYVSDQLSQFWRFLEDQELLQPSLVVLTSDHGEALGGHGEPSHGFFVYEETLRVPLIFKLPGTSEGGLRGGVSRLIDVLPTILPLLQLRAPPGLEGSSLFGSPRAPRVNYAETFMPQMQFGWSELRSFQKGPHKYIHAPSPELYDLEADPQESSNLYDSNQSLGAALRDEFLRWLGPRLEGPSETGKASVKSETLEQLASLGYLRHFSPITNNLRLHRPDPKLKISIYQEYLQALSDSEDGALDRANARLQSLLKKDSDFFQGHFLLGVNLGKKGRLLEAIESLRRTLELAPDFVMAENKLVLAYEAAGLSEKGMELLNKQLARDPSNYVSHHNLAAMLQRRNRIEEAIRHEDLALQQNPDYADAWAGLGTLYLMQNRDQEALEALLRAAALGENATTYYLLSLAYQRLGQADESGRTRGKACKLDAKYCGPSN